MKSLRQAQKELYKKLIKMDEEDQSASMKFVTQAKLIMDTYSPYILEEEKNNK